MDVQWIKARRMVDKGTCMHQVEGKRAVAKEGKKVTKGSESIGTMTTDIAEEKGAQGARSDAETKAKESADFRRKKLPYMGITKPLGAHLMASTKERIWRGEYVEMMKLLHRELRAKEGSKEEEYELAR